MRNREVDAAFGAGNVSPDLTPTLDRILTLACAAIRCDWARIRLVDRDRLVIAATYTRPGLEATPSLVGQSSRLDEGFCGHIVRTGRPFRSEDVKRETRVAPSHLIGAGPNDLIRAFLGVPLTLDDAVIGVLELASHAPNFFQEHHVELAEVVADQAAIAIHNARLAEARRQLAGRQKTLIDSLAVINSTLDVESLVHIIVEQAVSIVDADGGALGVVEGEQVAFREEFDLDRWVPEPLRREIERALIHPALRTGQPVRVDQLPAPPQRPTLGPILCIPSFGSNGQPLGILLIRRAPWQPPFDEGETDLLEAYAHQVAIALEKARLLRAEREQRLLSDTLRSIAQGLKASLRLGEVFPLVLDQIDRLVRYDSATIGLIEDDQLHFVATRGNTPVQPGDREPLATLTLSRAVVDTGRPLLIEDCERHPRYGRDGRFGTHRGWLGVPLQARGEVIGILSMDRREPSAYTRADASLMSAYADQAALAIQNARLYEETLRLRDFYQSVLDSVDQFIYTVDRSGIISGVNAGGSRSAEDRPRFSPTAVVGRPLLEMFPARHRSQWATVLERLFAGESAAFTDELHWRADGEEFDFRVTITPLRQSGSVVGATVLVDDISDRKWLERQLQWQNEALRASNDRLAALLDGADTGIIMLDAEERVIHINRPACELFGVGRETVIGQPKREVIRAVKARFAAPNDFEERLLWLYDHPHIVARDRVVLAQPEERYLQRYSAPVYADDGQIAGRIEIYTDVTASVRMERHIRRYVEELMTIQRAAVALAAERDPDRVLQLVAEQAVRLVNGSCALIGLLVPDGSAFSYLAADGFSRPEQILGRPLSFGDSFAGQAIRERRALILADIQTDPRAREREAAQFAARAAVAVPLIVHDRPTGVLVVLSTEPNVFQEHDVQILSIFSAQAAVIIENTHLLREAQERQRELQALKEFSDLLIEHIPTGVAVLDRHGRYTRVNPALCQMTGYAADELEGRRLVELFPEISRTSLPEMLDRVWQHGEATSILDFHYPDLARGEAWFDLSLVPVAGPGGEVEAVMVAMADITARKRLEADLRQRNETIQRQLVQHRALYEIGIQINAELDLPRVLEAIIRSVRPVLEADGVNIYMPRAADPTQFEYVSAIGLSEEYLQAEQALYAESVGGLAIRKRVPVLVTDVGTDPRLGPLHEAIQEEALETILLLPFVYREEVVGVMGVYHRRPYRYGLEEMELLSIFTSQATSAVKNAQLHQSVLESTVNLNAMLESMTDGVAALNQEGRVIFTNRRLYELLGLDPEIEIIGKTTAEILAAESTHSGHIPNLEALHAAANREPGEAFELLLDDLQQRVLAIVTTSILGNNDQVLGRLVLFHDITEIRANERLKDELISIIGHELRTPLTSILGYSKLLIDRPDVPAERRGRWARFILEKSRLLNRLINDVLDLSRLNMGRFELQFKPVRVDTLIRRVVDEFSMTTDRHQIVVDISGDAAPIQADEDRLEQVLTNLLSNAIKYSPGGGLIQIRLVEREDALHLSVTDHGVGIAREHLSHIFEPFYRVDNSSTRSVYGTGLGLTISRGIVEAHGGTLTAESVRGEGTTFRITLPRQPEGEGELRLLIDDELA